MYFLADAAGSASAHAAEAVGFRLMDVRVTLARDLGAAPPPAPAASGDAIGAAVPGDDALSDGAGAVYIHYIGDGECAASP